MGCFQLPVDNWRNGFPSIYPKDGVPFEVPKRMPLYRMTDMDRMVVRGQYGSMLAGLMEVICLIKYREYLEGNNPHMRFTSWLSRDELAPPPPANKAMVMVNSPVVEAYCVPGNDDVNGLDYYINSNDMAVIGNEQRTQIMFSPYQIKVDRRVVFRRYVMNLSNMGKITGHNEVVDNAIDSFRQLHGDTYTTMTLYVMHDIDSYKNHLHLGLYVTDGGFWVSDGSVIAGGAMMDTEEGVNVSYIYRDTDNEVGPIWVKIGDDYKRITSSNADCKRGLTLILKFPNKTIEESYWTLQELIDNQCPIASTEQLELRNRADVADSVMAQKLKQQEHEVRSLQLDAVKSKANADQTIATLNQRTAELKAQTAEQESRVRGLEIALAEKTLDVSRLKHELDMGRQTIERESIPVQQAAQEVKKAEVEVKRQETEVKKAEVEVKRTTASTDAFGGILKTIAAVVGGIVSLVASVLGIFAFFRR